MDGKLTVHNRPEFDKYLGTLKGEVEISVRRYRKTRTIPQNRYYWKVIVGMISEDTGQDVDTVHSWLKTKFNKQQIMIKRTLQEVVMSTTTLDSYGFSEEYWEPIRQWANEFLGLVIPEPE